MCFFPIDNGPKQLDRCPHENGPKSVHSVVWGEGIILGENMEGTLAPHISSGSLLSSLTIPPSFDIALGRLVKKSDTEAGFVEWVTDHPKTSVTESLDLWLEPNTSRRRLLAWLL